LTVTVEFDPDAGPIARTEYRRWPRYTWSISPLPELLADERRAAELTGGRA